MKNRYTATVISVGDEILQGKVHDTNSHYLLSQLNTLGITVEKVETLPDRTERIQQAVQESIRDNSLTFITGGLGPTLDDCTREAVAKALNRNMSFSENCWQMVQERYPLDTIPEVNKRQAFLIDGAESLYNHNGTAPGMWIELPTTKSYIALLPGPPREMEPMFQTTLLPKLAKQIDVTVPSITTWRLYGAGESTIAEILEPFGIPHGCYTKAGWIEIQLIQGSMDTQEFAQRCTAVQQALRDAQIIQTEDTDLGLQVLEGFLERGITLSFAESLTGGELASTMVAHPGASKVLLGSVIAYSNSLKQHLLAVPEETLIQHGAVSKETAAAMAQGVRNITGADITVSVTGIAGPDGGSEKKPVGTLWMGVTTPTGTWEKQFLIPSTRRWVIRKTTHLVYGELLNILESLK